MRVFKNWPRRFYLKLSNIFLARYYLSIESLPIQNFTKCLSGDLSQISKNKYYSETRASAIWADIFDQHIKAHGLPESYTLYLSKMVKAVGFYEQAYTGKKWQIVRARVCEAEAQNLLTLEGEKIETTCARISKFMGFPVRADRCTVVEFYNYIAIMKNY